MNNHETRGPCARGPRRQRAVIDLNTLPRDVQAQEATSIPGNNRQTHSVTVPAPMIDVDAFDDDVVESSPRAFAEAKTKSRSNRVRPVMVDLDSGRTTRSRDNNTRSTRRRVPPNQTVIDCERDCVHAKESVSNTAPAPPAREEPTFSCPICMCPFTQETSTKCGHIFCKECIKTAIAQQGKCPTCRKRVTAKELIRVFLPASR